MNRKNLFLFLALMHTLLDKFDNLPNYFVSIPFVARFQTSRIIPNRILFPIIERLDDQKA